jgi:outer membrane protein assembly factor BamB
VYALGAQGDLTCLDADSGKVIWNRRLTDDYKTKSPVWGFAAHPLVDGQSLYCIVGGPGSVAVAFDKDSGKELWSALSAASQGYCPPTMIRHGGRKQLLIWHPESLNSLDPKSGQVYWSMELQPGYQMSIAAPRLEGDYLYASGIGNIGALYELDQGKPAASVVWRGTPKNAVYASNTTPIIDSGVIYGVDCSSGALTAARIEDGRRLWETMQPTTGGQRRASHGTAFIVKHKNGYFLFSETGDLILANLSPQGYREISRFHVLDPTNECFGRPVVWSHPAFANRCAYVRNDEEIVCVSLATR